MKGFFGAAALFILGCSSAPLLQNQSNLFQKYVQYLPNEADSSKRVEFFIGHPQDQKKHPALIFVHAYQDEQRSGGYHQITTGRFEENIKRGYVTVSVSQPGFGGSDGPSDYSGPLSQGALKAVLEYVIQLPCVDPNNIALYGYSRGALTVALTSVKFRKFKVMILGGAQYNLEEFYRNTSNSSKKFELDSELGPNVQALSERSLNHYFDRFAFPTLIIHGEKDQEAPLDAALNFSNELKKRNVDVRLALFPDYDHNIPTEKRYEAIYPFLEEFLSMPSLSPILEEIYSHLDQDEESESVIYKICRKAEALCPQLQGKKRLHSVDLKKDGLLRLDYNHMRPGSVAFFRASRGSKIELAALYTGRKTMDGDFIFLAAGLPEKRGWIEVPLQSILSNWNYSFIGWADITSPL